MKRPRHFAAAFIFPKKHVTNILLTHPQKYPRHQLSCFPSHRYGSVLLNKIAMNHAQHYRL